MKKRKSWKKEYLRILLSEKLEKEDWPLASELIDSGHADGKTHWRTDTAERAISILVWRGATTEGRLFADKLESEIKRASLSFKLKSALFGLIAWVSGIFTPVLISLINGN